MKCKNCNAEWSVSAEISSQLVNCPFCGKPLVEDAPALNTLEDVLREILRTVGEDGLRDGNRAVSYFADLAPQLTRERRMLRYFMDCGGGKVFLDSRTLSAADQRLQYQQVRHRMCDELMVAEQAADQVCAAFWTAVCGTPLPVDAMAPALQPVAEPVTMTSKKDVYAQLVGTLTAHGANLSPAPTEPNAIAVDPDEAEKLYHQGMAYLNGGSYDGQRVKDKHKGFTLLLKAAELGNDEAMRQLGFYYCYSNSGEKDAVQGAEWYRKAAELGNEEAMNTLGTLYYGGRGVKQDYVQAAKWYRKAAELGNDNAMWNLGAFCYQLGRGVERDYVQMVEWYRKAAELGNVLAMDHLGECYAKGDGVKKDPVQAVEWFRKSAELDWHKAMYELGLCYENGTGVKKDLAQAKKWFQKAAEKGNKDALPHLNALKKRSGLFSLLKG